MMTRSPATEARARAVWRLASCGFGLVVALLLAACGESSTAGTAKVTLAPESALPEFVRGAPPKVKEAYRFAIANPDVLRAFPCYCGCGSVGHKSNLDCYIKTIRPDGSMEFDDHSFG